MWFSEETIAVNARIQNRPCVLVVDTLVLKDCVMRTVKRLILASTHTHKHTHTGFEVSFNTTVLLFQQYCSALSEAAKYLGMCRASEKYVIFDRSNFVILIPLL